ncbi:L,D-transpeptidase family protein [Solitalea sp. MAHUQ-68]|uniref:L,D-transpeptidase family protein n=1 Tax=Solitalea agri TaxID=2953739 RepID=A0A9X2JCD2_9SPHI|nr:L,D-transpeptidase family protein [Solitalea agri]MCO4292928.1 L,D-transpeptidase family protein [Solitalea agri]
MKRWLKLDLFLALYLLKSLFCPNLALSQHRAFVAATDSPNSSPQLSIDSNSVKVYIKNDSLLIHSDTAIISFYQKRNYTYQWINLNGLNEQARSLRNLLRSSFSDLSPRTKDYFKKFENGTIDSTQLESERIRLELSLTSAFIQFIKTTYSRNYDEIEEWFLPCNPMPVDSVVSKHYQLKTFLNSLDIKTPTQVNLLEKEIMFYQKLQNQGNWNPFPFPKKSLKVGAKDSLILSIKKRLHILKGFDSSDTSIVFDEQMQNDVIDFQNKTGLTPDGIIGKNFIKSINISPEKRVMQLLINIQRLKWLPERDSSEYILVNIPEFEMHVYQGTELCWSSPVVVGKPSSSTALFTGNMKYIVFSPYWNVPPSIVKKEIIPEIKKNRGYINKEQLEFWQGNKVVPTESILWEQYPANPFPYSVKQKPGSENSLGLVKFLFPNEYDIYLHDTPSKSLFKATSRSFSHGCIRISEPQKLAEHLLRNERDWDSSKITATMNGGKETWVTLKRGVPVSIIYLTAWVDDSNILNFRDDVYGFDKEDRKLLFKLSNF